MNHLTARLVAGLVLILGCPPAGPRQDTPTPEPTVSGTPKGELDRTVLPIPEPTPPPRAPEPGGYALPPEMTRPQGGQSAGVQAVDALPLVFEGISPRKVEQAVEHFDMFWVNPQVRRQQ